MGAVARVAHADVVQQRDPPDALHLGGDVVDRDPAGGEVVDERAEARGAQRVQHGDHPRQDREAVGAVGQRGQPGLQVGQRGADEVATGGRGRQPGRRATPGRRAAPPRCRSASSRAAGTSGGPPVAGERRHAVRCSWARTSAGVQVGRRRARGAAARGPGGAAAAG